MNLTQGQKIVVRYTDATTEEFKSVEEAEKGILETVTGCDFACGAVEAVQVVDADENEVSVLSCKWSLTLEPN